MRLLASRRITCFIGGCNYSTTISGFNKCGGPILFRMTEISAKSGGVNSRHIGKECQRITLASFHCSASLGKAFPPSTIAEPEEHMSTTTQQQQTSNSSTSILQSIKQRGLYHEALYRHWRHHKVKAISLSDEGRLVDIDWNDGHKSRFHAVWLRHNCLCPQCRVTHNNMVDLDELDVSLRVTDVSMEGDEVVLMTWSDQEGNATHSGYTLTSLLRKGCYSLENLDAKYRQRAMTFYKDKTIPEVEYSEVVGSEKGLYSWLKELSDKGICLVKNVPTTYDHMKELTEMIGPLYQGVYGLVWNIISDTKPIDASYTSQRLYHHMDQIQQECPPGIQILHCLKFDESIEGGENQFVDAHEVAHEFREKHPDLFDTLCRVPYSPQTIDYDRDYKIEMYYQRTIFTLNHRGDLINVCYHPTMQGPLSVAHDDVIPFFKAYTTFAKMINYCNSQYHIRLRPGDFLSFNNRRLTHYREAFGSQGERHLQGTYVDSSIFQSKAQYLRTKYGDGLLVPHCGTLNWQ